MNSCIKTIDYDDDSQMPLISYSKSHSFTKDFKNIQDSRSSNKNTVNLFLEPPKNKSFSSKKISISNIKFGKQLHKSTDNFSQIASKEKNFSNISKDVKVDNDMSFELKYEL
ncbi:2693_t:CDS:1 [Gigaspora rosea]|nr:2693_t:CDS:1 [Gigaspora rosea]